MSSQVSAKIHVLLLLISLAGCLTNRTVGTSTSIAVELNSPTAVVPTETETTVDVVIDSSNSRQTTQLKVGQILQLKPPSLDRKWQIAYDPDLFRPITLPKDMQSPGAMGWVFEAVAPGEGSIILVSIVECANPPCPLMPVRFQFNFQVK
jgi:hypothetical protein